MTSRILRFPRDFFGRPFDPWTKELIPERKELGNNVPDDVFLLAYRVQVERSYYVSLRTLTGPVRETQSLFTACCVLFLLLSLIPTHQTLQESKKHIRDKSNDCILR